MLTFLAGSLGSMAMLAVELVYLTTNTFLAVLEVLLTLFFDGIRFPRLLSSRQAARQDGRTPEDDRPTWPQFLTGLLFLAIGVAAMFLPEIWQAATTRRVVFVDRDGHPIKLARVIVQRSDREEATRSNLRGEVRLPRWDVTGLRLEDFRFERRKWPTADLAPVLAVQPSPLAQNTQRARDWLRQRRDR